MKNLILSAAVTTLVGCSLLNAAPTLSKKWETDAVLKTPESVLVDADGGTLYVSNIDGEPWAKDGKGSIGKLGLDGKVIAAEWVTGLHCPKGMALHKGRLYVADAEILVVIDVKKGAIVDRLTPAGAEYLNDVTVANDGTLYVSDSRLGKIHQVKDGKATVFLEDLKTLNGVLSHNGTLYLLSDNSLFKVGADKTLTKIVDGLVGNADGLENIGGDEFIVSCWRGTVHHVNAAKQERHLLLDWTEKKIQAADIGVDAKTRTVFVPTFFDNRVVAFEVK